MPEFAGVVLDDVGAAVNGATVNIYDINTTTPSRANTTTDSSGLWAISHGTRGAFDVKIVNGTDVIWLRARDRVQFARMELLESAANLEALVVTRTEDVASVEVGIFEGDRATPADGDAAYWSYKMSDSGGTQEEVARVTWTQFDVNPSADGGWKVGLASAGSLGDMFDLSVTAAGVRSAKFPQDMKVFFGAGDDATIEYDGTDLIISPAVVGSGDLVVTGASIEFDDSEGATFGTGKDATIQYDGTDLVINPDAVGSGVVNIAGGAKTTGDFELDGAFNHDGSTLGVYGAAPATKPTVTGDRLGNAALADFLTEMATLGFLTDSSTSTGITSATFLDKTADQTVTSSETLVNDTHLTFAVGANEVYAIWGILKLNSGTTPDFKFQWSLPASATLDGYHVHGTGPTAASFSEAAATVVSTLGSDQVLVFHAMIDTAGTSGTAVLQWAQNTSDAGDTKVLLGSWMAQKQVA